MPEIVYGVVDHSDQSFEAAGKQIIHSEIGPFFLCFTLLFDMRSERLFRPHQFVEGLGSNLEPRTIFDKDHAIQGPTGGKTLVPSLRSCVLVRDGA